MITVGYRLGIDYGTSNTAAVIHEDGGRARPLLFDGFPQLPSSVCVGADGRGLLVGREAIHAARVRPEWFEPHPKRRIDDGTVLLGDGEYPVTHLIAAVLAQVRSEAVRTMGGPPAAVALTYPAAWASRRRALLSEAARLAELGAPGLVPEPVAAASYFALGTGADVPIGSCVVVYDFGAGTFDASVVRRTGSGWDVAASDGLADVGGLDVDAAIVAYLGAVYSATHPAESARLDRPESGTDRRARRNLWEDVRTAKEILSRSASTYVHVPILEQDAPLGREQVERLAGPVVERTVAMTRSVIAASVPAGKLAGLFLVGGSSRMPLVATLLHRVTKVTPTVIEQPELAVAHGSVVAFTAPSRTVRPRAEIRERAAVPGAAPVSEETVAIVVRSIGTPARVPAQAPGPGTDHAGHADNADNADNAGAREPEAEPEPPAAADRTAGEETAGVAAPEVETAAGAESAATKKSAGTKKPAGTEKPAVTEKPAGTVDSAGTRKLAGAEMPAGAEKLARAEKSAGTVDSAGTKKPAGTRKPALAKKSAGTEKPAATNKPAAAGKLAVTTELAETGGSAGAEKSARTEGQGGAGKPAGAEEQAGAGKPAGAEDEEAGADGRRRDGGWSLALAVLLLGGLVAMTGLSRNKMPEWDFWLGDALLYPAGLLWLAYRFGTPVSRTQWRLACYVLMLLPGCIAAYLGAGAIVRRWGTGPVLWMLGAVVMLGVAGLVLRRGEGGGVGADGAGMAVVLAGFAGVHVPDYTVEFTYGVVLAGGPVVVAFAGLGAALGRYVVAREPAARRWLPFVAAALLVAGGVGTALRIAAELR